MQVDMNPSLSFVHSRLLIGIASIWFYKRFSHFFSLVRQTDFI